MTALLQKFPVFFDPNGNRWRKLRRVLIGILTIIIVLAAVLIYSFVKSPNLPDVKLKATVNSTDDEANNGTPDWANDSIKTPVAAAKPDKERKRFVTKRNQPETVQKALFTPNLTNIKPLSIGFYVNWDDTSFASLKRNLPQLDWVVPEWIRLQDGTEPLVKDFDQKALDLIQKDKPETVILPLVQNYVNEQWNSPIAAKLLATDESRQRLINSLLKTVQENRFGGVTIDIEAVPKTSQANLFKFMTDLHTLFHTQGLLVAQAVPFDDGDWDYKAYANVTDYLMLMAYDEHWSTGAPGAIASQGWFEKSLQKRLNDLNPAKTIVCIGNYGYDWSNRKKEAPEISFQEAVLAARDSDVKINFDATAKSPYFSYDEDDGSHHTVWFQDALTAYNQIHFSQKFHPAGYALWRLGSEDPSLWNVFGTDKFEKPDVRLSPSDVFSDVTLDFYGFYGSDCGLE